MTGPTRTPDEELNQREQIARLFGPLLDFESEDLGVSGTTAPMGQYYAHQASPVAPMGQTYYGRLDRGAQA